MIIVIYPSSTPVFHLPLHFTRCLLEQPLVLVAEEARLVAPVLPVAPVLLVVPVLLVAAVPLVVGVDSPAEGAQLQQPVVAPCPQVSRRYLRVYNDWRLQ